MFHGLTYDAIYSAVKTTSVFESRMGEKKEAYGTSFGVIAEGKLAIVTNRHMVDLNFGRTDSKYIEYTLTAINFEVWSRGSGNVQPETAQSLTLPISYSQSLLDKFPNNVPLFDANSKNDVAVIFDAKLGNIDCSLNCNWDYCFVLSELATEQELIGELLPFDFLAFPGFPAGYDKIGPRPIIRGGTVACDPRFPYNFESKENGDIVLFEGFSFGGSSGSPVLALPKVRPLNVDYNAANKNRRFMIVGVNAGHIWATQGQHAGLSYFVRSSVIRRIIHARLAKP